jgi:hypothetical protein
MQYPLFLEFNEQEIACWTRGLCLTLPGQERIGFRPCSSWPHRPRREVRRQPASFCHSTEVQALMADSQFLAAGIKQRLDSYDSAAP